MADLHLIVWKEDYVVGHEELDQHHRTMFTIINDLYARMIGGASDHELRVLFKKALAYAQMHFNREEDILRGLNYPSLDAQQKAHRTYLERVKALAGPTPGSDRSVAFDMLEFLKEWWLDHILGMDRGYAPFLHI